MRLVRPLNVVMFLVGVGVGGVLAHTGGGWRSVELLRLAVAAVSAACIGGAANAINDVFDLDIDRVNRPERPLPSGRLPVRFARGVWIVGTGVGLALALLLGPVHLVLAAGTAAMLWAYSAKLKRVAVAGNLVVAFVLGLALVYGGLAVGGPVRALAGGLFAALTTFAREVIKDVEDMPGDRTAGARTLPLVAGPAVAVQVAVGVLLLTVVLMPVPYLWLGFGPLYLFVVGVTALALLLAAWPLISSGRAEREATTASARLKGAMVLGLLALALA